VGGQGGVARRRSERTNVVVAEDRSTDEKFMLAAQGAVADIK